MNAAATDPRPTLALALGAGGAKGLAHIGVIEELEARGFRVAALAGASMGALIGGVHAMGKLAVYRDWVVSLDKLDVLKLVDWTFGGGGLIKGERIMGTLRELTGDALIEDLALPYTAVATDIERGREVWLSEGSLYQAIRASIAIPSVFRPWRLGGRLLVDGALLNPVPVTPLIRSHARWLVAVSVDGPSQPAPPRPEPVAEEGEGVRARIGKFLGRFLPRGEAAAKSDAEPAAPGALDLMLQSMDLMQATLSRLRLAAYAPDLLIQLPHDMAGAYEFYRAKELIELGRAAAREALDQWQPARGMAPAAPED